MEEYKTYTLDEISRGKGSYGIAASAVPFNSSLFTYLRITDINDDGSLNKSGLTSVDEDNAGNYLLKPNDIVFARTGNSTGRAYFYDGSDGELVYAGFLIKFSLDESKVNPRILKYYAHSKPYYDWVRSFDTGGTRGNINAKTYGSMPITLPSRPTQDRIVEILKSLDDKIEVNRRINENLEQQAQALFKSWFVDFEPFKDQPFVESELGMIPQGWKVVELGDLVEIIDNRGKTPPLESKDLYPIIDVKALTGPGRVLDYNKCSKYVNHETYTSWFRSGHPKKYDILLSTVGSLAETKLFMGGNGCIAQNVVALRNDYISLFLYDYLNRIKSDLVAYNIGSVQPSIKVTHIIKHKIILPQADVLDKYISLSRKLTENIYNYSYEIDNLSSLRDELLPKLMSGELNVENVNF